MKPNRIPSSIVGTSPKARFLSNNFCRGKTIAFVTLALLLLGFSAPAAIYWNWGGGDRNWSNPLNWDGGVPTSSDAVIFGNTDAQPDTNTVNTVDASMTVSSLAYTNNSVGAATSYQNTTVASGQTLTIGSGLTVGYGTVSGATANIYTVATMTGVGGTVAITGGNVAIGHQSLGTGASFYIAALWDMRGLDNFSYNNASGTFSVAGNGQRRQGGEVYLAGTNVITANAIPVGIAAVGVGAHSGILHLGSTNSLFANTITVSKLQDGSRIDFQTGLDTPGVKIRGADGVSPVANWYLGWNSRGDQSASNSRGYNDFSPGILDAIVGNLYVGYMQGSGTAGDGKYARGYFTIGTNSMNSLVVQNLYIGNVAYAPALNTITSAGVFTVGGGTVTAGAVALAQQLGSGLATGTLSLADATMQVNGDLADGGGTSTITVSNATLTVAGRIGAPTTANNVETVNLDNATLGLTLVAPGDYTKAAASVGALNIEGGAGSTLLKINDASPSPGQYPLIAYTSLGGAAGFSGLSVQAPPFTTVTLSNNTTTFPSTIDVIISTSQLVWDGLPNGNWNIGGTANWKDGASPATYTETGGVGSRVLFNDDASGTTTVDLTTILSPLGITVNNANKNYTFGGSGKLSGVTGLIKLGTGTLTLAETGVNDYQGTTYVGNGKLQVGTGGTGGNIGSGPLSVDGTVEFNRSDDLILTNTVSGSGGLNKLGANTLTLAGPLAYAGPTAISAGTLGLSPADTETLPGNITGSGGLAINGPGTVVLTGSGNSYSGDTLISAGTLQIGDGINSGSLPGNVVNHSSLVFNGGFYNLINNITGSGEVSSVGTGAFFTLAGANTYSGTTTIRNGGTLYLGAAGAMPPSSVLVLGQTSGSSIGSADFTGYNVVIGGLNVGGNSTSANQITLGSGQSLTVNGNVNIGNTSSGGAKANLTVVGPGASLIVNADGGLIQIGLSTSGAGGVPNSIDCNLTGLDVFTANLGATGLLRLGEVNTQTGGSIPPKVLRLAATNTITAGTIGIGNGGKSITPELHLGSVTNVLNADLIKVGNGSSRDSGRLLFEGATGSVRVRGSGGESTRANLNILVGGTTTGGNSTNSFDVTGHYADLLFDSLVMGDQGSRQGAWDNYFGFDQGILDASSVSLSKACRLGTTGTSLMRLGGGTVTFGSLALASSSAAATLEISGGAQVSVNSDVTKTGSGVGTIQVVNATLLVKGRIGTQANPLDFLSVDNTALSVGRTLGYGNPTTALINATNLSISGTCTIALTGTNYVVGQFPLISYTGTLGGGGFAAIGTFTPPPGVSATLVDNPSNQSIDVNITAAPPIGPKASISLTPAPGSLDLTWLDLGMILETNAVSVASPTDWFTYPGSTSVTNVTVTVDPGSPNVYFRLLYP
jgi:autotransporter-associated beta strand protein